MIEGDPEKCRTIKVRPNPPIIPPPSKSPEVPNKSILPDKPGRPVSMRPSTSKEQIDEESRPSWLPPGATAVKAAGQPSDISLSDEYNPTPESDAGFRAGLTRIQELEDQARRDSFGVVL